MSLFASTSPSYLIMQSLDMCSDYICGDYAKDLERTVERVEDCKRRLRESGWFLTGDEPAKITVAAYKSGLSGSDLADRLRDFGIEPEYSDSMYTVLMITPFNSEEDFKRLESAMDKIPRPKIMLTPDTDIIPHGVIRMGIREAAFSPSHRVDIDKAAGKICGMTVTCCQPSVPVAISGEEITPELIKILKKYSICEINVL
jgi:arginine/lysine/ornithine decarboxylase